MSGMPGMPLRALVDLCRRHPKVLSVVYKSAIGLLVIGHLRYYMILYCRSPLVSEALQHCASQCGLLSRRSKNVLWSTLFVAGS